MLLPWKRINAIESLITHNSGWRHPDPLNLAACILFSFRSQLQPDLGIGTMPGIEHIRAEIERMRAQVHRQRGEIRQLQRAGIPTTSAEALLDRMLDSIDRLCAERDRLKKVRPGPTKGNVLGGRSW
jgi:hypothetical protein